jgi:phosphoglycolate phosphatase-like HAD superfamily hydrolase
MKRSETISVRVLSLSARFAVCLAVVVLTAVVSQAEPLASWNEGPAKRAILDFVRKATDPTISDFVPPAERIAVFDNDGTLWVEQPLYTQVVFAADRVRELAPRHADWKERQPFKSLLTGDDASLATFSIQDFAKIVAETHAGITVSEFEQLVSKWLKTARHPRFNRPYTELGYLPMLEVMQWMRANDFKTYIVTGGGQDFVRVFADPVYGVVPEQVIGSAGRTGYRYAADGKPELEKLPEVLLIDDRQGKPEGIHLVIGRRPYAAFGNSTGDQQMLEWTQGGQRGRLMMLVHHDDAEREYAYGANSKIGTFSAALKAEADQRGWTVISMKNDWKRIFAWEK